MIDHRPLPNGNGVDIAVATTLPARAESASPGAVAGSQVATVSGRRLPAKAKAGRKFQKTQLPSPNIDTRVQGYGPPNSHTGITEPQHCSRRIQPVHKILAA
jgi:hypothetical protein